MLLVLLLLSPSLAQDAPENGPKICTPTSSSSSTPAVDPEMFSKLKLNIHELHGSRWAYEQKEEIEISHSIDIMDAALIQGSELTLRVEFNLRQSWVAPGLEFPPGLFKDTDKDNTFVSSTDKVLQYMWNPDSYISTTRESSKQQI